MRPSTIQIFAFLLPVLISGCRSPHHVLDYFFYKTAELPNNESGVVFYDWWRAQPGVNVVNDPTSPRCRVLHSIGFDMGFLPGRFCLFLDHDRYFSVTDRPTLYNDQLQPLWRFDDPRTVKDAIPDEDRDWIWLILENSEGQQEKIALSLEDGQRIADTTGQESPAGMMILPSENEPLLTFENGNKLFFKTSLVEMSAEGRLVWQWNPETRISRQELWIRRVNDDKVFNGLRLFKGRY